MFRLRHSVLSVMRSSVRATFAKHPRQSSLSAPAPVVWVLSGGGAAAAGQVGMARALLEAGQRPDILVGCSAGALNAAFLAADPTLERVDALEEVWQGLSAHSPLAASPISLIRHLVTGKSHLLDPRPLDHLISSLVGASKFEDLACPLHVVTSALPGGAQVWHSTGPLAPVLLASSALPGLLPPVPLPDGLLHVDGAVTNLFPVDYALGLNPSRVWALDVAASVNELPISMRAADVLLAGFALSLRSQASRTGTATADPRVQVLNASVPAGVKGGLRDFKSAAALIKAGYQAASSALAVSV